ncbi:MAG: helix-turn-helix transcriptional regulator [Actinobacteria bacterium]|nr:MAG: helix-turn-helix transcriptional regulator [Actinomycetota bacterium]
MRWSRIAEQDCSVARALSVVGDRWTMLVLREAFMRTRRFEDFQVRTGAPRPVLAERLRTLVDNGVLERRRYSERPDRYEYRLTDKGRDLYPVVVSLLRWGDRWMTGTAEPPVELRHRACGHQMHPELACPECGEWVDPRDVDATARR